MGDSKRQKAAIKRLEEVVKVASREADDPGLRARFTELPRAPIRIICSGLDKGINHGNILRIADAYRVESVSFTPLPRKERDFSGCFAAIEWVPVEWLPAEDAIDNARSDGYRIYGLTLVPGATPLPGMEWGHPAALVLGRELEGLEPELVARCDETVAIPMYGMVTSLNVAVSAALAIGSCLESYVRDNPDFVPARTASQALLLNHRAPTGKPDGRSDESLS